MRVLVFSDLHGDEFAVERLRALVGREKFDYVLSCGDNSRDVSFLEELFGSFSGFFTVPGNWEGEKANEFLLKDKRCINEKRTELKEGLNLVGFGYSNPTPFGTYGELSEEEIYERMKKLDIDGNTILLLHCPPKGYFDEVRGGNAGSESVLKIIEEKKPLAALFGHIHETEGTKSNGETMFVKVPAANSMRACIIETNNKKLSASFIELR